MDLLAFKLYHPLLLFPEMPPDTNYFRDGN